MAVKTENYNTDFVSRDYYSYLVNLRKHANQLYVKVQAERDQELQQDFKWFMKLLVREMEPKYMRREDKEKPEVLKDEQVENMQMNDLGDLLQDISELQELLGITSMAKNEYEVQEKGAVKKE